MPWISFGLRQAPRPAMTLALVTALLVPAVTGCAPAVVATGAAVGVTVAHDRRTTGTLLDDNTLAFKVRRALNGDPDIKNQAHINITTYNGVVLLTGEVPDPVLRARAGTLAETAGDVRLVHNELLLQGPTSTMSRTSDTLIHAKLTGHMLAAENFDPTRVEVTVEQGTVFLMGLVTREEAAIATEISRRVSGVAKVVRLFEYLPEAP